MSQSYRVVYRPIEPRDYPVTIGMMVLAVAATVYRWLDPDDALGQLTMNSQAWGPQPWRLITPVFLHSASPLHLLGNLSVVWPFGMRMEPRLGSWHTFWLYLFLGFITNQAEYAFTVGGIGLSGIAYGMVAFLWAQNRWHGRLAGLVDKQTVDFLVFFFFLCIALTYTGTMPIANYAHGSGILFGALVGWAGADRRPKVQIALIVTILALTVVTCLGATVGRRYFNPRLVAYELTPAAIQAYDVDKNYELARKLWIEILDLDHTRDDAWFNLGLAEDRLNHADDAMRAYGRAYQLKPEEPKFREVYLYSLHVAGRQAAMREDYKQAEACWQQAVDIDPRDQVAWRGLAALYTAQKRTDQAEFAFTQAQRIAAGQDPLPAPAAAPEATSEATTDATGEATPAATLEATTSDTSAIPEATSPAT